MGRQMKLTGKWRIEITGDIDASRHCARSEGILSHIVTRLLLGREVDVAELESWGIKVSEWKNDIHHAVKLPRMTDHERAKVLLTPTGLDDFLESGERIREERLRKESPSSD